MSKRELGRSGIRIAPLVLGGNVFGWTADEATSFDLLDRFVGCRPATRSTPPTPIRAGSPGNEGGESETIIGKWMKPRQSRRRS